MRVFRAFYLLYTTNALLSIDDLFFYLTFFVAYEYDITRDKMKNILMFYVVLLLPLIGTTLGSIIALFTSKVKNNTHLLYGFSAGVMLSASIWSLLIPSMELLSGNKGAFTASISCFLGAILMYFLQNLGEKLHKRKEYGSNVVLAVILHNFPEGVAVGICLASCENPSQLLGALSLSLGVAIQNIPEGAIVSMQLAAKKQKFKALVMGIFSGIVELVGAIVALLFTNAITFLLPALLSFSAGCMLWVTFRELLPNCENTFSAFLCMLGFLLMMLLDTALSFA